MFTGDLIDSVITYDDNVDASDADNTGHRARILLYCQEVFDYVWYHQPWTFKQRQASVTVLATTAQVDVPADFGEIGYNGKIYDTNTGRALDEITFQMLNTYRKSNVQSGDVPTQFAIGGWNSTTKRKQINILNNGGNVALTVAYDAAPTTLLDTKVSATSGLEDIPAQYHSSVLIPGVRAWTYKSFGSKEDWFTEFQRGLSKMTAREMELKSRVSQMARHSIGMH